MKKWFIANEKIVSLFITIIFGVFSLFLVCRQIEISEHQNEISQKQIELSEQLAKFEERKFYFEVADKWEDYLNEMYDKIKDYDTHLWQIDIKIQNNEKVEGEYWLRNYVNLFEDIGDKYCSKKILQDDLRAILKNTLWYVCFNQQIEKKYPTGKNWFYNICTQFYPESILWKKAVSENCKILPESMFE